MDAIRRAREHFVEQYGKDDHRSWARVIAAVDGGFVLRLCYGHTKPPRRAYFRIDGDGNVSEMEFAEVRKYGERPWR